MNVCELHEVPARSYSASVTIFFREASLSLSLCCANEAFEATPQAGFSSSSSRNSAIAIGCVVRVSFFFFGEVQKPIELAFSSL